MLAKRRILKIGSSPEVRTPILLPSFSSKGFPKVASILKTMEEYISDELLISAYDIHFRFLQQSFDFASTIFLDSGGYEASKEYELSETYDNDYVPKEWSIEKYYEIISKWTSVSPTVFVSFDHPKQRMPIIDQISRAKEMVLPNNNSSRSFLIKPEGENSKRLHMDNLIAAIKHMTDFSIIGVTEKEIGNSILNRMINVARLRREIDLHHKDMPIHVFGSLDTISTYLYFLAGADIFDGLTWLRYAFSDGDTVYRHSYGALNLPISLNSDIVEGRCWTNNYQHMQEMRLNMLKYLSDKSFDHFGKHSSMIKNAYQSLIAEMGG